MVVGTAVGAPVGFTVGVAVVGAVGAIDGVAVGVCEGAGVAGKAKLAVTTSDDAFVKFTAENT